MLTLITGVPGAGKTAYSVQRFLIPAISEGRIILTNVSLRLDSLRARGYDAALVQSLGETHSSVFDSPEAFEKALAVRDAQGRGPLVVVDEAHRTFWPKEWEKTSKEGFEETSRSQRALNLFASHRHTGADIVLLTQSADMLPRDLIRMSEILLDVHNLRVYGFDRPGCKVYTKDPTRRRTILHTEIVRWDKTLFSIYSSRTLGGEEAKRKIVPWWRRTWGLYVLGAVVATAISGSYFISNISDVGSLMNPGTLKPASSTKPPSASVPVPGPSVVPSAPLAPAPSQAAPAPSPVAPAVPLAPVIPGTAPAPAFAPQGTLAQDVPPEYRVELARLEIQRLAFEAQQRDLDRQRLEAEQAARKAEEAEAARLALLEGGAGQVYRLLSSVIFAASGSACSGMVDIAGERMFVSSDEGDMLVSAGVYVRADCEKGQLVASLVDYSGAVVATRPIR